jgi:hypothetical protein
MEGGSSLDLRVPYCRRRCQRSFLWPAIIYVHLSNIEAYSFNCLPTCFHFTPGRDVVFLDRMKNHAMTKFAGALLLHCDPASLSSFFGPVISWLSVFMGKRVMKKSMPIVRNNQHRPHVGKQSLLALNTPCTNLTSFLRHALVIHYTLKQANRYGKYDTLQQIIDECYASKNPDGQLRSKHVYQRFLFVNDVSLLTTAYTARNLILALSSADPSIGDVDVLGEECDSVLSELNGRWTLETIKKLLHVDSGIRESVRMVPFGTLTLRREVGDVHQTAFFKEVADSTCANG